MSGSYPSQVQKLDIIQVLDKRILELSMKKKFSANVKKLTYSLVTYNWFLPDKMKLLAAITPKLDAALTRQRSIQMSPRNR